MNAYDELMVAVAEAPSNIALIKYMGKRDGLPVNSSLSYTLDHLRTAVTLKRFDGANDEWQPLDCDSYSKDSFEKWTAPKLSEFSKQRFLNHFRILKSRLGLEGSFVVRSANNFPADCGIASSASSFAALTLAAFEMAKKINPRLDLTRDQIAQLSRKGSGSSIRSFYGPFALWSVELLNRNSANKIETADHCTCASWHSIFEPLHHQVIIVDKKHKLVSSSEAHKRVETGRLFHGRAERAEERLKLVKDALNGSGNWRMAYEIANAEFWDMHALFHTAHPPFRYLTAETLTILDEVDKFWERNGDGPLVTLDAGPNVHLLYRSNQLEVALNFSKCIEGVHQPVQIFASYNKTQELMPSRGGNC